jgi:hypothetical protein
MHQSRGSQNVAATVSPRSMHSVDWKAIEELECQIRDVLGVPNVGVEK